MQDKPIKEIEVAEFVVTAQDNVMPDVLKRYQANKVKGQENFPKYKEITALFDDDVIDILVNLPKTNKDRQIINGLIRAVYA
ncbi:hypothetical protein [Moraxella oblonga]|uniref:hypothetical protein n=1 Tax=Moraxella oblonga TaxID=200413 RepID=UPI0008299BD9|nr:hypothetical protein [Moraxella oblonga]